jgi:hypothetical protein
MSEEKVFSVLHCVDNPEIHLKVFDSKLEAVKFVEDEFKCAVSETIYGHLAKGIENEFAFLVCQRYESELKTHLKRFNEPVQH